MYIALLIGGINLHSTEISKLFRKVSCPFASGPIIRVLLLYFARVQQPYTKTSSPLLTAHCGLVETLSWLTCFHSFVRQRQYCSITAFLCDMMTRLHFFLPSRLCLTGLHMRLLFFSPIHIILIQSHNIQSPLTDLIHLPHRPTSTHCRNLQFDFIAAKQSTDSPRLSYIER